MEIKESQERAMMITTDIICDCCGKSCKKAEITVDNELNIDHGEKSVAFEYMKLQAFWGFYSNKDEEKWTAHLCEDCVDKMLSFVKFQKEHYNVLRPQ
jgi:hypothetical protein